MASTPPRIYSASMTTVATDNKIYIAGYNFTMYQDLGHSVNQLIRIIQNCVLVEYSWSKTNENQ